MAFLPFFCAEGLKSAKFAKNQKKFPFAPMQKGKNNIK